MVGRSDIAAQVSAAGRGGQERTHNARRPAMTRSTAFDSSGWLTIPDFLNTVEVETVRATLHSALARPRPACANRPGNGLVLLRWDEPVVAAILGSRQRIAWLRDLTGASDCAGSPAISPASHCIARRCGGIRIGGAGIIPSASVARQKNQVARNRDRVRQAAPPVAFEIARDRLDPHAFDHVRSSL